MVTYGVQFVYCPFDGITLPKGIRSMDNQRVGTIDLALAAALAVGAIGHDARRLAGVTHRGIESVAAQKSNKNLRMVRTR
jgi:hypothetical protein